MTGFSVFNVSVRWLGEIISRKICLEENELVVDEAKVKEKEEKEVNEEG